LESELGEEPDESPSASPVSPDPVEARDLLESEAVPVEDSEPSAPDSTAATAGAVSDPGAEPIVNAGRASTVAEPADPLPAVQESTQSLLVESVDRVVAPTIHSATASAPSPGGIGSILDGLAGFFRRVQVAFFNRTPTVSFDMSANLVHADGTITGRVEAADPDGDPLTFKVTEPVNGGTVTFDAGGNFTYTPGPRFEQAALLDSFEVTVSDAAGGGVHGLLGLLIPGWGSTATVAVTVRGLPTTGEEPGTDPQTAAGAGGWGEPVATVDFTDEAALQDWWVYDAPGNGGAGWRTPDAVSFTEETMIIAGEPDGTTGGMMWQFGQKYGAWEVRVRVPEGAPNYNAVALLWPSTDTWPRDGEIDFMEIKDDATRQNVTAALHYSPDGQTDRWVGGNVDVDGTEWHNYAVSWTPTQITTYVDGVPFFTSTDVDLFPPYAMQLCLQFDVAGPDLAGGGQMEVAWARAYSLDSISSE
jgi:hypothetical protein